jgi:hypothetical protein
MKTHETKTNDSNMRTKENGPSQQRKTYLYNTKSTELMPLHTLMTACDNNKQLTSKFPTKKFEQPHESEK